MQRPRAYGIFVAYCELTVNVQRIRPRNRMNPERFQIAPMYLDIDHTICRPILNDYQRSPEI